MSIDKIKHHISQHNWYDLYLYLRDSPTDIDYASMEYLMDCIVKIQPDQRGAYVTAVFNKIRYHHKFDSALLDKQIASEFSFWRFAAFQHKSKVTLEQCLLGLMDTDEGVRHKASDRLKELYPDWSEE